MELQLLNEKVNKTEEGLEKLTKTVQATHEETYKQSYQIDQLYKTLGNGWSGQVTLNMEALQDRVTAAEKNDIQINNKLDILSNQLAEIKEVPHNNRAKAKDYLYITMALISIGTVILNVIGVV